LFSHILNSQNNKQLWAIKINKLTQPIYVGVCLETLISDFNFSSQNFKWE